MYHTPLQALLSIPHSRTMLESFFWSIKDGWKWKKIPSMPATYSLKIQIFSFSDQGASVTRKCNSMVANRRDTPGQQKSKIKTITQPPLVLDGMLFTSCRYVHATIIWYQQLSTCRCHVIPMACCFYNWKLSRYINVKNLKKN
jgi:hypothetical protein